MARDCNVGAIYCKDESSRLGLQSFKALGGAYAVARMARHYIQERTGDTVSFENLQDAKYTHILSQFTVTCATDGNHGRSVAWGASLLGCQAVIYLHAHVPESRERAITAFGAHIRRVQGIYDVAVAKAAQDAKDNGWTLVSDTTSEDFDEAVAYVLQGYNLMSYEICAQLEADGERVTHIFLQAGVGGLAAAVSGYMVENLSYSPRVIIVEPDKASCLLESAKQGRVVSIPETEHTTMEMLACYEPSRMAWSVLERTASHFIAVSDACAQEAVRILGDAGIPSKPSGACGVAGLLAPYTQEELRVLGIDETSRILCINTEGDAGELVS